MDKLYFNFNGKKYGVGYRDKEGLGRESIINNHYILLIYKKSILDTYVIEDYKIISK